MTSDPFFLLFPLSLAFQIGNIYTWIEVPRPPCRLFSCLDRTFRTEMDTTATELATVFPYRSALDEVDISRRTYRPAGATGRACVADGKFTIVLVDM
jgi:hypothetical protein